MLVCSSLYKIYLEYILFMFTTNDRFHLYDVSDRREFSILNMSIVFRSIYTIFKILHFIVKYSIVSNVYKY